MINSHVKSLIKQALKEDIGRGDITTQALIPDDLHVKAVIVAKQSGVIAGLDVAEAVFVQLDKNIRFKAFVKDGDRVAKGKKIVQINGRARAILTAERTVLNFLGRLSGIATLTRQFVDEVKPYKTAILDTRKTTPGLRVLEKYAVKCGGGVNHRIGLWDGVLIKENHLKVTKSPSHHVTSRKNIKSIIEIIRKNTTKGTKIEIEVENLNELKEALKVNPDIVLLDNMNINQIKKAVTMRNNFLLITYNLPLKTILLEVSGGVNLNNVRQIAKAGAERISIGSLTHSAPTLDLSLKII